MLGSYDLSHRRFDDGDVLLRGSAADSDAGDDLALAHERYAAAHRGVSTAGDSEEGIEFSAWLHKGDEVSGAHADERGRVGLSLGELDGECGRSGHAVDENNVSVAVDDARPVVARATQIFTDLASTCGWLTPPAEPHWPPTND